jgi:hypothetical protein
MSNLLPTLNEAKAAFQIQKTGVRVAFYAEGSARF